MQNCHGRNGRLTDKKATRYNIIRYNMQNCHGRNGRLTDKKATRCSTELYLENKARTSPSTSEFPVVEGGGDGMESFYINSRKKVIRQYLSTMAFNIRRSMFSVQCAVFACWHFLL